MWYIKSIEEVYKKLNTSEKGLTNKEIEKRLQKFGENMLPNRHKWLLSLMPIWCFIHFSASSNKRDKKPPAMLVLF